MHSNLQDWYIPLTLGRNLWLRYAKSYIISAGQTKSRRQIERTLLQKGISKEQISEAYAQCSVEEDTTQEQKLIEKLLEKKRFDRQNATYADRQKMGRGYGR